MLGSLQILLFFDPCTSTQHVFLEGIEGHPKNHMFDTCHPDSFAQESLRKASPLFKESQLLVHVRTWHDGGLYFGRRNAFRRGTSVSLLTWRCEGMAG